MNETGNEQHICAETVPSILDMDPKAARRAWQRFMADHDWTNHLWGMAERVRLSIGELILNLGRPAEETSRKNLADRLAKFKEAWTK